MFFELTSLAIHQQHSIIILIYKECIDMLKGIPSVIGSDLLAALAEMGHGDMILSLIHI